MNEIPVVYIAGKYSDTDFWNIDRNIHKARKVAIALVEAGIAPITPHLNHYHFEDDCGATYGQYLAGDLEILKRCDAIFLLDNWMDSAGTKKERLFAMERKIPIFESIEELLKWKENGSKSS